MNEFMLIEISSDRDGEIFLPVGQTLGSLSDAVNRAVDAGVPLSSPLTHGYSRTHIADGIMVLKPVDITTLGVDALRAMATSRDTRESKAAWDEIERRIRDKRGSSAGA